MIDFCLHPNVYTTSQLVGLRMMLERIWVREHKPGDGTIYIVSGFANYNGGARFYRTFKEHTEQGGKIVAVVGGSTSQKLSSKQAVEALLACGAEVTVINRKRLLHAKCYGVATATGQSLVVTSGNFTGPGMSQNVEASILVKDNILSDSQFSWEQAITQLHSQNWLYYKPNLTQLAEPGWSLLYDETPGQLLLDESEEVTLILILGHADTVRVQAAPNTVEGRGSQYFWLSKDSFDFFPPLTSRNKRGYKGTLSTLVHLKYVDLGIVDDECRVTFEAENNLDFRLGTGKLRNTQLAGQGDIACISRIGEDRYELRIIKSTLPAYPLLDPYAINYIGHQGKRYGYIDNTEFERLLNVKLGV